MAKALTAPALVKLKADPTKRVEKPDGVLTGLQIAAQVALTGRPLKDLAKVMTKLPQVLINVKGVDRTRVKGDVVLAEAVAVAEAELGDTGRVLLRPSGTEPVVRVMVEAASQETAQAVAERLAQVVRTELALELVAD